MSGRQRQRTRCVTLLVWLTAVLSVLKGTVCRDDFVFWFSMLFSLTGYIEFRQFCGRQQRTSGMLSPRLCSNSAHLDGGLCQGLRATLGCWGFAAIDNLTEIAEIRTISMLIEDIVATRNKTYMRDLGDNAEISDQPQILEIASPSKIAPALLDTRFFLRALTISRGVLGPAVDLLFDHCIVKPAFNNTATAWHQDCAYGRKISFSSRRIHWWLPLQDATLENGCMEFVAGSHHGRVLPHCPRSPRAHALQVQLPSDVKPTACPVPVGGVTVHLPKTIHGTGPNRTAVSRIAWILQFGIKSWKPALVL
jgi:Phytanoyl-CoA dioxygenase (PhyH)